MLFPGTCRAQICNITKPKIKKGNKLIAHIAVLGTLMILISLIGMRLPKSIDQGGIGLYRVIGMIATSSIAFLYFIKSFIDNRKSKK